MYLIDHLLSRGVDPTKYPIYYDEVGGIITFMLYNMNGSIVGYQQYRPSQPSKQKKNDPKSGRYFTYLPSDTDGVFGLDVLNPLDRTIYQERGPRPLIHPLSKNSLSSFT